MALPERCSSSNIFTWLFKISISGYGLSSNRNSLELVSKKGYSSFFFSSPSVSVNYQLLYLTLPVFVLSGIYFVHSVFQITLPMFVLSGIYLVHSQFKSQVKDGCNRSAASVKFSHSYEHPLFMWPTQSNLSRIHNLLQILRLRLCCISFVISVKDSLKSKGIISSSLLMAILHLYKFFFLKRKIGGN